MTHQQTGNDFLPQTASAKRFLILVAILLLLVLITTLVMLFTTPLSMTSIAYFLVVCFGLIAGWFMFRLFHILRNTHYVISGQSLAIYGGGREFELELSDIRKVMLGKEVAPVSNFRGLRYPGVYLGQGHIHNVGKVQFVSTVPQKRQLLLQTQDVTVAISPEDISDFVDKLAKAIESGGFTEIESRPLPEKKGPMAVPMTQRPTVVGMGKTGAAMLVIGGALNLILLVTLAIKYPSMPRTVDLIVNWQGEVVRTGSPTHLLLLGAFGTVCFALNGVLGTWLLRRSDERVASYLLWFIGAILQIVIFAVSFHLIRA